VENRLKANTRANLKGITHRYPKATNEYLKWLLCSAYQGTSTQRTGWPCRFVSFSWHCGAFLAESSASKKFFRLSSNKIQLPLADSIRHSKKSSDWLRSEYGMTSSDFWSLSPANRMWSWTKHSGKWSNSAVQCFSLNWARVVVSLQYLGQVYYAFRAYLFQSRKNTWDE